MLGPDGATVSPWKFLTCLHSDLWWWLQKSLPDQTWRARSKQKYFRDHHRSCAFLRIRVLQAPPQPTGITDTPFTPFPENRDPSIFPKIKKFKHTFNSHFVTGYMSCQLIEDAVWRSNVCSADKQNVICLLLTKSDQRVSRSS